MARSTFDVAREEHDVSINQDKVNAVRAHMIGQQREVIEAIAQRKGKDYAEIVRESSTAAAALRLVYETQPGMESEIAYSLVCVFAIGIQKVMHLKGIANIDMFDKAGVDEFNTEVETCMQYMIKRGKVEDILD